MTGIHGGDIYRNCVELDFSVNVNPLGMPEGVPEALHDAVARCGEYPDIMVERLKKAVAGMLSVPEEWLLFGNGASELFMGIVHGLRPGKVLIPVPSFYGYEYAAGAAGSEILYYPLSEEDAFTPDAGFLAALTEDVDLVFFANPNNPTGRLTDRRYLGKMLDICQEKGIWVVLDECFIAFCAGNPSVLEELRQYDRLLLVRAFTKIFAIPGVRLGYLVCSNPRLLEKIGRQLPEWNLSTFAQEAGMVCAGQSAFVARTADYVGRERKFLEEELTELGLKVFPGEANFLLIQSKMPLYEGLLERGVLIRDCGNFRGLEKGYYRIAVKKRKENEILIEKIRECMSKEPVGEAI